MSKCKHYLLTLYNKPPQEKVDTENPKLKKRVSKHHVTPDSRFDWTFKLIKSTNKHFYKSQSSSFNQDL